MSNNTFFQYLICFFIINSFLSAVSLTFTTTVKCSSFGPFCCSPSWWLLVQSGSRLLSPFGLVRFQAIISFWPGQVLGYYLLFGLVRVQAIISFWPGQVLGYYLLLARSGSRLLSPFGLVRFQAIISFWPNHVPDFYLLLAQSGSGLLLCFRPSKALLLDQPRKNV